jgi:hypothetical protein
MSTSQKLHGPVPAPVNDHHLSCLCESCVLEVSKVAIAHGYPPPNPAFRWDLKALQERTQRLQK